MERLAGRVVLLWGWRRALLAFAAGAIAVLTQPPFDFFAAGFLSFTLLVWLLDGAAGDAPAGPLRRLVPAFATGWWFGLGYFAAGLWWVGNALLVEAESFAWALPLAVVALPALLAVFYGLAAALARLLWSDGLGRIAALAAAFAAAEFLRSVAFTGFPWNAIGYAAMPVPVLMQSVSLVGMVGMNALAVFVFAMPALVVSRRHRRAGFALAGLVVALHAGFGLARLSMAPDADEEAGTLSLRLVQPSIVQSQKWDPAVRDRIFATYLDLSARPFGEAGGAPELIVWPETAVPFIFTERPDALAALGELLGDGQKLFAGAVRSEGAGTPGATRYYNAVVSIDGSGSIADAVDKVHLVPFGEYMPFSDLLRRAGVERIVDIPSDFSAASSRQPLEFAEGRRAAVFICYEIIFPGLVAADVAGSDLIVNVTNDAWFGDTFGPYQHFRQAQLRAVETGLPLVRSANNGISAAVDAYGRIVDAFAVDAVGVLDVELPLARGASMRYGRPGMNGWIVVLALAAIGLLLRLAGRRSPN